METGEQGVERGTLGAIHYDGWTTPTNEEITTLLDQAQKEMRAMVNWARANPEGAHRGADAVLIALLGHLGYADVVELYNQVRPDKGLKAEMDGTTLTNPGLTFMVSIRLTDMKAPLLSSETQRPCAICDEMVLENLVMAEPLRRGYMLICRQCYQDSYLGEEVKVKMTLEERRKAEKIQADSYRYRSKADLEFMRELLRRRFKERADVSSTP